jgi:UDP-2,4-diacetamido-2,4,6-trideoxy-beta-L-altropyranose hydrolase
LKILFITAGGKAKGKQLGLGHIFRTIHLAKQFKKSEVLFLIQDFGGVKNIFYENGFKKNIFSNSTKISLKNDIKNTKELICKQKIDIVVVDKYNINKIFIKSLKKFAKVVIIRDLFEINFSADMIINGFIGFQNTITENQYGVKCILGPKYQILNQKCSEKEEIEKKIDLLVTFGGFDEKNIALKVLELLPNYLRRIKVKIILGPVAKNYSNFKRLEKKFPQNLKIIQKTSNMCLEIKQARFGLCSGGLTTYEFNSAKTPFAIICDEKHQLITAKEWEKRQIAINMGLIGKKTNSKITKFLDGIIFNDFNQSRKKVVDGNGAKRVAYQIKKLL